MDTTRDHRLIVALDHDDPVKAQALVEQLGDRIGFYKIGLGSLNREGFSLIEFVRNQCCKRLFLDLKLFDIGSTVSRAARTLANRRPEFFTVRGHPPL
ncbi:MAG: orotidine 5'-phosphate decarboxylase, partial [Rhodobacteraceae bacterium]|nr:orotidine 5'-phosphate decarboxylase [Paracoccaceae bacterium]